MDDGRLERIERRIEELDQRESATERALETVMARSRAAMGAVVPHEARRHMRAAWRENILAVRSMLDHWAEHLNDGAVTSQLRPTRHRRRAIPGAKTSRSTNA